MPRRVNLVGDRYGEFVVKEMHYNYNGTKKTYCTCMGDDGKEYFIRADALRCGATKHTKNAEHKQVAKNITGIRFGKLVALYPTKEKASNGAIKWHCRCDCGNEINVSIGNLLKTHTRSCGCNRGSKWQDFIKEHLNKINVNYEYQKFFPDCLNKKGNAILSFDFYLPDFNSAIEYDGFQHFEPVSRWGGESRLKKQQENDSIKNEYCKKNGINLLRIPYWDTYDEVMLCIDLFLARNDHSLEGND